MKKKLILATVIVLLLAISVSLFVGCDRIFTRNDERDMTQVVARVHYNGETADVYKFELASSFSSYAYYYVNYYGMTAEAAANYIVQSLAQQRLLVLYARQQVYLLDNGLDSVSEGGVPATEKLLTPSELNKAVEDANESLLSSLQSLITSAVTEDNYNKGTDTEAPKQDEDDDDTEITDPVVVRFESNGGGDVESQRIQKGHKAEEPDDPTRDGYTFYGWYQSKEFEGEEFDFSTAVNDKLTLYAKWEKYTAPRTEMPAEEEEDEEEDDYDPDSKDPVPADKKAPEFFSDEYYATIPEKLKDADFIEKIEPRNGETEETALKRYIDDALSELKTNLQKNLYKGSVDECYDYYLNSQYDTLIVDRLERRIGDQTSVTEAEIQAEFDRVVSQNKESFGLSDSAYSSALGSSLASTYYHPDMADGSYGFVTNILLRLDTEHLDKLTAMLTQNPASKEAVKIMRNRYLSELKVKVSNPMYKSTEVVKDENGEEIELRDPMTDPNNPYNGLGKTFDKSYQHKVSVEGDTAVYENDYDHIVSFAKNAETGKYEITYGATEHPAMAYLLQEVPAFDYTDEKGTKHPGIIHQIYLSFEQVKNATDLDEIEKVVWLRELATKWAYLVGDDTGAVTSSSNNNGLGYLITPEGEESNYLKDFTSYARELVKAGTGSYSVGEVDENTMFDGVAESGNAAFAGNNVAFVVADSFIDSGSTSGAYAGVFVLLNSYTVWDSALYKAYSEKELPDDGTLPLDFYPTLALDREDMKTIKDLIKESLETTKKSNLYNLRVNTMGADNAQNVEYFEKTYKSLWKSYSA